MNSNHQRRRRSPQGGHGFARRTGQTFLVLSLLAILLAGHSTVRAQEPAPSEYAVKAAFLYNFGKFVNWPAETFTNAAEPLVIGVYGGNPFHGDLEQLVANKTIANHPVIVKQITVLSELKTCQILFVNSPDAKQTAKILGALGRAPVLTVTENVEHFPKSNFMINFVTVNKQIHFEINNEAARNGGVKISSKLLTMARQPEK